MPTNPSATSHTEMVEYVKDLVLAGGSGWVLWLLFSLAGVATMVAVERVFFFRQQKVPIRELGKMLEGDLEGREFLHAFDRLTALDGVAVQVAKAALRMAPRGLEAVTRAVQSASVAQRQRLERRLSILATIGNNAPFVGLLGTVIGVMMAFEGLGEAAQTAQTGPSQAVLAAIAEALVATAVGIAVAIPCVAVFNGFSRRVTELMDDAEIVANLVMAYVARDDGQGVAKRYWHDRLTSERGDPYGTND